jgi:subtilisin family serine protease
MLGQKDLFFRHLLGLGVAVGVLAVCAPQTIASPSVDSNLLDLAAGKSVPRHALTPGLAPQVESRVEPTDGGQLVDVLLFGTMDRSRVQQAGGSVRTVAGPVMTVSMPLSALYEMIRVPGLQQIQLAQPVAFQSDISIPEIEADDAWGGPPPNFPPSGKTGKNVILGVVDTGIDVDHWDFKTSSGQTRIKYLWDQMLAGSAPSGFSYGAEYTSNQINAGIYSVGDSEGHGTHMAGIAAGNGRATGNGVPKFTYMGVAPEADLVIVRLAANSAGTITDDKIIDGVNYVFQKASQMGRPAVVLLGQQDNRAP